mmetsp:Transcript_29496/g.29897  ORF Transcript_29496/g.29897 Transcript_29496/m.29897 type:complete len:98 (-) Transcript_29496:1526-1819(-)
MQPTKTYLLRSSPVMYGTTKSYQCFCPSSNTRWRHTHPRKVVRSAAPTLLIQANDEYKMKFLERCLIMSDSADQRNSEITYESNNKNFMASLRVCTT